MNKNNRKEEIELIQYSYHSLAMKIKVIDKHPLYTGI